MPESYWESFNIGEDIDGEEYGGEEESAEFLPLAGAALGLPGVVGGAVARRLLRGRGRRPLPTPKGRGYVPPPPMTRPLPATQQQLGVATGRIGEDIRKTAASIKTIEGRLDAYSAQLAALQQKRTGEQSADLFRYALTSALTNIPTDLFRQDWARAVYQTFPLIQTMVSGKGGVSAAVSTMPLSTFGFPLVSGLAVWFLRKPEPPVISIDASKNVIITLPPVTPWVTTRYTHDKSVVDSTKTEYKTPTKIGGGAGEIPAGSMLRAKNFNLFGIASDEAVFVVP